MLPVMQPLAHGPGNPTIYHEKQQSACCGRHALNNLLGGYRFSDPALAEIALTLYEEEKALHASTPEGVHSMEYSAFVAGDNPYVDNAGNFSIEVLERALAAHGASLSRDKAVVEAALASPERYQAYLLNRANHWYSIRRVGGHWVDLNSFHERPQHISDFFMSAFLAQMRADQYSIFVVSGALPAASRAFAPHGCLESSWHSLAEVLQATSEVKQRGRFRAEAAKAASLEAESDPELARALRESMMEGGDRQVAPEPLQRAHRARHGGERSRRSGNGRHTRARCRRCSRC